MFFSSLTFRPNIGPNIGPNISLQSRKNVQKKVKELYLKLQMKLYIPKVEKNPFKNENLFMVVQAYNHQYLEIFSSPVPESPAVIIHLHLFLPIYFCFFLYGTMEVHFSWIRFFLAEYLGSFRCLPKRRVTYYVMTGLHLLWSK